MAGRDAASKRVALCAMLLALSMIFSYVESLIPISFGVPGIKLGVANLVVVVGLYFLKPQEVFLISMSRILLMACLFGNIMSLAYSLAGGVFSFLVMLLLKRAGWFGIAGTSVAGGVCHNIAQICVAVWVVHNVRLFYYLPVLLAAGVVTGLLIGVLSDRVFAAIKK